MYEPTLEEMDIKIQEVLIDARKIRQSWFKFEREESKFSRIIWYTLYKNNQLWVKLSLTEKNNKGIFDWVEPPQYGDSEIVSIFDIYNTWLFSLRGWGLEEEQVRDSQDDKKDEENKYTKSLSIVYPASISHFRAWMDRYLIINGEEIEFKDNNNTVKYRIVYMPQARESNREIWLIQIMIPATKETTTRTETKGMILAIEDVFNKTKIEFLDGKFYLIPEVPLSFRRSMSEADKQDFERPILKKGSPIGKNFPKVVQSILQELIVKNESFEIANEEDDKKVLSDKKKEISLKTKPAGRKIDPWNPVAFDIMNDGKKDAQLRAYQYWCEQQKIKNPTRDDRKNFKKAMRREEERRGRNRGAK